MNTERIAAAVVSMTLAFAAGGAFAQDRTSPPKDGMHKDSMKNDGMAKDSMQKDRMKKDEMKR